MNKLDRHLKALELDKVLERLAGYTACEDARECSLPLTHTRLKLGTAHRRSAVWEMSRIS